MDISISPSGTAATATTRPGTARTRTSPSRRSSGIPATNPWKNGGGYPETFAWGFRNPFRFSIDRESNEVWVGDVGQDAYEEIDAKIKIGGNYGWPCREGTHPSVVAGDPAKCPPGTVGMIEPVVDHAQPALQSIVGGVVYRGKAIPDFVGSYVYGDFVTQQLWTLSYDPGTGEAKNAQLDATAAPAANWVDFAEDNDGEIYAVALNQGAVYKMLPAAPAAPSTFPDRLSKTGCVDPADAKKPASGLVAYGVNSPFWSDGAIKDRWLALPDGKNITVKDADGDFDFPNGTVLVKTFTVGGKRIETRPLGDDRLTILVDEIRECGENHDSPRQRGLFRMASTYHAASGSTECAIAQTARASATGARDHAASMCRRRTTSSRKWSIEASAIRCPTRASATCPNGPPGGVYQPCRSSCVSEAESG